jgi:hypothetical protein
LQRTDLIASMTVKLLATQISQQNLIRDVGFFVLPSLNYYLFIYNSIDRRGEFESWMRSLEIQSFWHALPF